MSESSETSSSKTKSTGTAFNFPLWAGALIGGLFLALFMHQAATNATSGVARIVVIDTNRLIQAKAMTASGKDAKTITTEAATFSSQLDSVVKGLTAQGYVVMNSAHMVGWPETADKTAELANQLGVDLKLADAVSDQYASRGREILQLAKPTR
ncbi:MAG: hypothetical protein KJZ92_15410 [Rhodocyclaceae bacterium]|nr:hypothetical protein [Opitutaceae bacterium]MCL4682640.1 hypothetical protein [Rhodocyclaceae bacterium]